MDWTFQRSFVTFLAGILCLTELRANDASGSGLRGFCGPQMSLSVLNTEIVARDLGLTSEQRLKLKQLRAEHAVAIQVYFERIQKSTPAEQQAMAKSGASVRLSNDCDEPAQRGLEQTLRAEQIARTREILYQMVGADVFADPTVVAELELTVEQRREIDIIVGRRNEQLRNELMKSGFDVPLVVTQDTQRRYHEYHQQEHAISRRATELCLELLNPQQKQRIAKLWGKTINVERLSEQRGY